MADSFDAAITLIAGLVADLALQVRRSISSDQANQLISDELGVVPNPIGADTSSAAFSRGPDGLAELVRIPVDALRYNMQKPGDWLETGLAALVDSSSPLLTVGLGRLQLMPGIWTALGSDGFPPTWANIDDGVVPVDLLRLIMAVLCDDLKMIRRSVRAWQMDDDGRVDWCASLGDVRYGTIIASPDTPQIDELAAGHWLAPGGRLILVGWGASPDKGRELLDVLALEGVAHLPVHALAEPLEEGSLGVAVLRKKAAAEPLDCWVLLPRDLPGDPPECAEIMECLVHHLGSGGKPRVSDRGLVLHVDQSLARKAWDPIYYGYLEWRNELPPSPSTVLLEDVAEVLQGGHVPRAELHDVAIVVVDDVFVHDLAVGDEVTLARAGSDDNLIVYGANGRLIGQTDWLTGYGVASRLRQADLDDCPGQLIRIVTNRAVPFFGAAVLQCPMPGQDPEPETVQVVGDTDVEANHLRPLWPYHALRRHTKDLVEIRTDDILCPSSVADACIVQRVEQPTAAVGTVIRPRGSDDPPWLLAYVLSPEYKQQVRWLVEMSQEGVESRGTSELTVVQRTPELERSGLWQALADLRKQFADGASLEVDQLLTGRCGRNEVIPLWVYGSMLSPLFCDHELVDDLSDWVALKADWVSQMCEALGDAVIPVLTEIRLFLADMIRLDDLVAAERLETVAVNEHRADVRERLLALWRAASRIQHWPMRASLRMLVSWLEGVWLQGEGPYPLLALETKETALYCGTAKHLAVSVAQSELLAETAGEAVQILDVRARCTHGRVLGAPRWLPRLITVDGPDEISLHVRFDESGSQRIDFRFTCAPLNKPGDRYLELRSVYLDVLPSPHPFTLIKPNPYSPGSAVSGDRLFGREAVLQSLREALLCGDPSRVVDLRGARRIGKTSLLKTLARDGALAEHVVAFLDCQRLGRLDDGAFFRGLLEEMDHGFRRRNTAAARTGIPPPLREDADPTGGFLETLDALVELAEGRRIILLIDEFERVEQAIETGTLSAAAVGALRHVFEHHAGLSVVLARTDWPEYPVSPLVQVLCNMAARQRLGPLAGDATRKLIQGPVGGRVHYPSAILDKAVELTGGYPYLTQSLCHSVVQLLNAMGETCVDDDILEEAVSRSMQAMVGAYANYLFLSLSTDFERHLLVYVASQLSGPGFVPRRQIEMVLDQHQIPWIPRLGPALHKLSYLGLLRAQGDIQDCEVGIGFDYLRRWLNSTQDLASLRHLARLESW